MEDKTRCTRFESWWEYIRLGLHSGHGSSFTLQKTRCNCYWRVRYHSKFRFIIGISLHFKFYIFKECWALLSWSVMVNLFICNSELKHIYAVILEYFVHYSLSQVYYLLYTNRMEGGCSQLYPWSLSCDTQTVLD